jgi:cytochrome c oxidase subunit I+III
VIWYWLWTGTAQLPEKTNKDVGLGLQLPLYASGAGSVGYWAVFITMLADLTAFASIVFGYFFFWTIHDDFPPARETGPGLFWPCLAAGCGLGAWALTLAARGCNRRDYASAYYAALGLALLLAAASAFALIEGPRTTGLDPTQHVYPATVWMLVLWSALHLVIGMIMQLYCLARRWARRMNAQHDIDICNVTLYWHFVALTLVFTVLVVAGFPLASRGAT